jgi:hypothetical protein
MKISPARLEWRRFFLVLPLLVCIASAERLVGQEKVWSFSGYGEFYFGLDAPRAAGDERPSFVYNHKRSGSLGVNLLMARASFQGGDFRANAAVMTGHYAHYNLAAEPAWARMLMEANAGLRLMKGKELWLDVGILPSHIGFESAVGGDCWTLTRSMVADNSPYYESGIRLSYRTANGKWSAALLGLNGWQRIQAPAGWHTLSAGMQLTYKPSDRLLLNYSNFLGNDRPDSAYALRLYHNLYAVYEAPSGFGLTAGFDVGQEFPSGKKSGLWWTPVMIARYKLHPRLTIAARGEYFRDADQTLLQTGFASGFRTAAVSLGADVRLHAHALFRLEGKHYQSGQARFAGSNNMQSVTAALVFR